MSSYMFFGESDLCKGHPLLFVVKHLF